MNAPLDLTPRQKEILGKICEGYSYSEVARELCIAEPTVRLTVGHARERTHSRSTVQLCVRYAVAQHSTTDASRAP